MSAAKLVALLREKGLKICCAESCTGGLISSTVVSVPGASDVLDMSFVTYANEAKVKLLGVDPAVIEAHGVVSEQVTRQMAQGAAKASGADVAIAVSGVAGPGGTPQKPEGTVCFGWYVCGKTFTETVRFGALGRNAVREASCKHAIEKVINFLGIGG